MKRLFLAAIACSTPAPVATGALGGGVACRAGNVEISIDVATRVANAQHISPREAAAMLADDAVASQGAIAKGVDKDVAWRIRAARARLVSDRWREEARAAGDPTDAEIADVSRDHWQDVDCPETRTVIHAIVLKPKNAPAPANGPEVAAAIRAAVGDAGNEADFERIANAVQGGTQKKVERLPPFAADGRIAQPGAQGGFDRTFAAAAFAIGHAGETSNVIETSFGWHVIRLVRIAPPHSIPWEERRLLFREEVFARRAQAKHDALLAKLQSQTSIDVSLSAEQSMALVKPQ